MIPESEWKFFEATEQRIKHFERHRTESLVALHAGHGRVTDPAAVAEKLAGLVQEMDYPARVEAAFTMDPLPEQARHLERHRQWILGNLFATHPEIHPLVTSLTERMLAYRPRLRERETSWAEIRRVLRDEEDRELREDAFDAGKELAAEIETDLKELFRLRETLARAAAGAGFAPASFYALDLERTQVVSLLDEFERNTRRRFEELKGAGLRVLAEGPMEPWDYAFAAARLDPIGAAAFPADHAWPAAQAAAAALGFGAEASSLRLVPAATCGEAIAFVVEIPEDVRVAWSPAAGIDAWSALFRAFGEGLHAASQRTRRHFLERETPAAGAAFGAFFAGVLRDPARLAATSGADAATIDAHLAAGTLRRLCRLRFLQVDHAFENVIYAQSDMDPVTLYRDVAEQTLACTRRPSARWATEVAFVTDPFRASGLLLGELAAAQLGAAADARFPGAPFGTEAGRWLREALIAPGAAAPWPDKVQAATGAPLDLDALRDALGARRFTAPALQESEGLSDEAVEEYFKDIDLSDVDTE